MKKYLSNHQSWKIWAGITMIPFAAALFLIGLFSAGGTWEFFPQAKLFFLFVQMGIATCYFVSRKQYRASVNLWGTIIFLWLISMTVPFLAAQTGTVLDSTDAAMEISTPLYIFMSCLTAAWLLPEKWRMITRIICVCLVVFYTLIQLFYIAYFALTHSLLSVNMMIAVAQTNFKEAAGYLELNVPYAGLAAGAAVLFAMGWMVFYMSRFSFSGPHISGHTKIVLLLLLGINCLLAESSAEGTRIAQVYSDTRTTLQSFGEYQKIVENRKHMAVADPQMLQKLKEGAPDGVYNIPERIRLFRQRHCRIKIIFFSQMPTHLIHRLCRA
jgi:heptose-I-phosphate ethanolaminephosphotransferase